MSSYYHTPLAATSILTAQLLNTTLGQLDRRLDGLHYGDVPWTNLGVAPANPAAGYVRIFFTGGTFTVLRSDGTTQTVPQYAALQHQEASGVDGAALVAGVYTTRTINVELVNPGFVSLAANVFTLPAGNYALRLSCPFRGQYAKLRLYQTAPVAGTEMVGSCQSIPAGATQQDQYLVAYLNPAASTSYRVENYAGAGGGIMGSALGNTPEVYLTLELWKF